MPDEALLFQTTGLPWSERAGLDELSAVLSPTGDRRHNLFLHGVHLFAARRALGYFREGGTIIDFGCGTGRFTRFFASHNCRVLATEVTASMLERAKAECTGSGCDFVLTDGVAVPAPSGSIDGIWCCAVLRYSLFVPNPAYNEIAKEMYRLLRPGTYVVNCEMYVDKRPESFVSGFENAGFVTRNVSMLHRYGGKLERLMCRKLIPEWGITTIGRTSAFIHAQADNPEQDWEEMRDFLFVWQKPFVEDNG